MRVKYPIDNLEYRIELVANSSPSLFNLPYIGYALIHGDFTNYYFSVFSVCDFPDYTVLRVEENVNKQKKYIIAGLDFVLEHLNDEWTNELLEGLRYKNTKSEFGKWRTKVKKIMFDYIIDNKNEFSDIYLEMMLG